MHLGAPLTRSTSDRVLGGVAAGLGSRLGVDPVIVRIVFVVLSLAGGSGLVAYVAAWLFLPTEPGGPTIAQRALRHRRDVSEAAAVAVLGLVVVFLLRLLGLGWLGGLSWPLPVALGGLFLIWRNAEDDDRVVLSQIGTAWPVELRARRMVVLRVVLGAVLILAGVTAFIAANRTLTTVRDGLVATLAIVGGVAIVFGPWWLRLARDLTDERRERIRSEERAEMATRVHDSVLQTLALIQRQADDPRAVVSLARRQERDLRGWLYGGPAQPEDPTLKMAVTRASEEVEETHGITVDAVVVGDCPLDDRLQATVAAAKEAMVNAAKWSGTRAVSLYAEVEPSRVSMFVRDRGAGFRPETVGPDHRGIAESIRGRMERHGGQAAVRTEVGQGTEVELSMPRPPG